jgi:hypothetical protein
MKNMNILKVTARITTLMFFTHSAFASPTKSSVTQKVHQELMSDVKKVYEASSRDLAKSGLKAFLLNFDNDFSEFDKEFLSTQIKGLKPLPGITLNEKNALEMTNVLNGKNHPIIISIADAQNQIFLVNGKPIKVDGIDTLEEIVKKVNVALKQPIKTTYIDRISSLFVRDAHAIETSTWIAGGIIAVAVGVILYRLGKKAGEKKIKKKISSAPGTSPPTNGTISEENPYYLENPATGTPDQSTDVITPGH